MLNKKKRTKLFARRAFVLGGFKGVILLGLISRLYYLQIIKSTEYKTISDSNRIRLLLLPPYRGRVLDRNNKLLAENIIQYRILLDPQFVKDKVAAVNKVSDLLNFSDNRRKSMLDKVRRHTSKRSLIIHDYLTWRELAKLEVNAPDLPGISIDTGQIRHYTMGKRAAHVIGYLGPVSEKEIEKNPLLNHPDFKIGRHGIEQSFEDTLRGKAGVKRVEVDAFGLVVRELSREESVPGKSLYLSLSKPLQEYIVTRLGELSASVSVMSVKTGDILAMVSTPSYDPNIFTQGVSTEYWQQLMSNPDKPMINKNIANQYPPGSTFKPLVALAALKEGIDPKKKVYCPGYVQLGRHRFHCWKKEGHGHVNMEQAIMHSCNSYFYTIAKQIGVDAIAAMAKRFGLGEDTGVEISGEKGGLVPTSLWKMEQYKQSWQAGDTLNVGIGQGYMLVTPVQLAMMASRVASGEAVKPTLLRHVAGEKWPDFASLGIPREHLDVIRKGMFDVVNVPGGTAFRSRIRDKSFVMAGKTGTVQVISKKTLEERRDSMTPEQLARTKNHAIFVGYGPYEDPEYAISVVVEHGGGGSAAAAPVARDIMEKVIELKL